MKVIVYVEGPSDRAAMDALLQSLIARKRQEGVAIEFRAALGKESLIEKALLKAALTVRNDPASFVVAMPDLYPKNKVFLHPTVDEMIAGITQRFEAAVAGRCKKGDERMTRRFRVFCFKHDLEALLLAAEDALKCHLGVSSFRPLGGDRSRTRISIPHRSGSSKGCLGAMASIIKTPWMHP